MSSQSVLSFLYLVFIVVCLVSYSEKNKNLAGLCVVLGVMCYLFFIVRCLTLMFFLFELTLLPILLRVTLYGAQVEKVGASYYLVFYTSFCAAPFFFMLLSLKGLRFPQFNVFLRVWGLVFLSLAFIMKFPVIFLHYWLPKAHVEAPTRARILLAGLLLKLGGVGLYRVVGVFSPSHFCFWVLLGLVGCSLSPLICVYQRDLKSLSAYSSIVHINFVFRIERINPSSLRSLSLLLLTLHGYISAVLFFVVGEVFHCVGRRKVYYLSGVTNRVVLTGVFSWTFFSNRRLPPFLSFIPEL